MGMHADEEHRLARDLEEEFAAQAITSGANEELLDTLKVLAGEPKADSRLAAGERLHLIALFHSVRFFALRRSPWLKDEMEVVRQTLVKRGVHEKAAALMVQRVAEEHMTNLISLADQTAAMAGLERKGDR